MSRTSGDLHIVDYKTKMVIASLKPEDYVEDLRHWELKDNADIFDVKLLDNSPFLDYIQQKNLILKETRPGVITPYIITEIAKDSAAHTTTIYASGEWIKLDKDAYISPQKITSKDAAYYMNFATARTVWEVGVIEAVGTRTMTIDTFMSPFRFIKEVTTLFDNVEIQYRIVMNPTKPPTRYIDLIKKRGRETDKEIVLGKDLLGIKRIENSERIITALVPFVMGRDADGNDKLITIESVNNGLQYIVDDAAYQRWNVDGKHLFGFYTPETDNEDMAPARLLTLAKTELKKRVDTIVSYEVDSVDISRVLGYEHEAVGEGDTIRIIDEGMTPTLYLEARAVAGDESHKDKRKNKYTFGNFVEIINPDEALRKLYQKMLAMIGDKVPKEWFGALEEKVQDAKNKADTAVEESQTAKDLANATKDYMDQNMVDVVTQPTPPTNNLRDGTSLWVDNSDPDNKVLKIYRGNGVWEPIVPDTSAMQEELDNLMKNIGAINGELGMLQQEVKENQQALKEQATVINKKVDRTWLDEEMKKKANTGDVYTKDYVDKNLVGKQIYEVDKQANIKGFQDMNTKYDQTAEAIKLTTTKDELKQTNQNVTNITKTVSEVKITAEENSKKITKVQGDFNNMQIGSVNLAIGSEEICDVKNAQMPYSQLKTLDVSNKFDYRDKKINLSYRITGEVTGKGPSAWLGAEVQITYVDGENQYINRRIDNSPVGAKWRDTLQSVSGTTKDKEIKSVRVVSGARDMFGSYRIYHVQLEEGTVSTAWHPATEEAVSTGDFTNVTNEIKQTVGANTATIQKLEGSFVNANYLVTSSANKEYPDFAGDVGGHQFSRATGIFENNYIKMTSTDGLDAFYQIGSYKLNDLRGLSIGKDYTFSTDLIGNLDYAHLVVFEHNGTGWAEAGQTPIKINSATFTRGSCTFKLRPTAKAFMLRIRFPMSANSTGKYIAFKDVKLEDGSIPTRWNDSTVSSTDFTKTTNEIKQTTEENSQTITKLVTKGNLGDNLIFNSDLSQRDPFPIGWTYTNKTDIFYQEPWVDDKRAGVFRFARTNLPANSPNAIISAYSKMFPVTINTDYTFSVYIKIPQFDAFVGDRAFIIEFFDAKGIRVDWQDVALTKEELASAKANKWTRIVRTMATKNASATQGGIRLALFNNGEIFYRMPQAEPGNMVTGWGLSSSDFVSDQSFTKTTNEIKQGIEENSQTITKVEKKVDNFKVGSENLFLASENKTVLAPKNNGAADDNYNYASIPVEMQMDREYTISARVKFTTAPPLVSTKITVYPYTNGVSTAVDVKDGYFFHTFKKTNANTKSILLYAGIAGSTKGIGAEFTEIMVTEGNQPVSYVPSKTSSSEFTKTTNEIKQTVDTNSQTITRVEKKVNDQDASIADVTKKTNEIKQTVDKNSQTITTLSTTQGEHGKLIQSNKSSIEQLNNEIKLTVSETQMEDYIGSLGTTNLFLNTPFEMKEIDKDGNVTKRTPSLDKWNFTNNTKPGVTVEASVSRHHAGYNSMHIKSTGQTSNIYVNAFQDAPMLSNSGAYVLSFWMYTEDVNAIDEGATVGMYVYGGGSQVSRKELALKPLLKSGAWVFIVLNVDAPTVPTTHARMYLTLVKNGSIYLSQPQYQQGTKPSTYMPNPKDITNYKEMIDLVGSKVATSDYNKQVTKYDTQFEQNTREINLRATKESVYTKTEGDNKYGEKAMVVRHESELKVQSQEISLRVKSGDIASTINQTAQAVLIQASKINLKGAVTADSIQSGRLDGVIITTKNTAVNPYWVHMQGQNITLKETKLVNNVPTDISRGYWGFMPNLGGSKNVIRTALVLGNNYDNANNVGVEGSLFIEHQTPDWNNYNASSIRIGRARSRNSDSSINTSAEILFDNDGSLDITAREGGINLISKGTTVINTSRIGTTQNSHLYMTADGDVSLDARTGRWQFNNGKSSSAYNSRTLQIDDKRVSGGDQADVDFGLGQYVMLRVPHHPSYTQYGLEIKNSNGTALQNIHVDTVYLRANNWTSAREKKTGIKDIEVDSLATMMALSPKQYYFKEDIEKLYDMRQAVIDGGYIEPTPTLNDIQLEYGFIADEIPDCLASTDRKTVSSYRLTTICIAGTQEVYKKHLALEETVKEQATQLAMQEDRIARLEELLLQQLINKKPGQP
jgi:phage minor structural protein